MSCRAFAVLGNMYVFRRHICWHRKNILLLPFSDSEIYFSLLPISIVFPIFIALPPPSYIFFFFTSTKKIYLFNGIQKTQSEIIKQKHIIGYIKQGSCLVSNSVVISISLFFSLLKLSLYINSFNHGAKIKSFKIYLKIYSSN